jgi:hypothetical protein
MKLAEASEAPSSLNPPANRQGPTYKGLGYKQFLIDFQFTDIDPATLKNADAEKLAEQSAQTGADALMVYAITNTGFALYDSKFTPKFKNLPDNFLGDFLAACRKRHLKTILYHSVCWQRILDVDHQDWAIVNADGKPMTADTSHAGIMGKTNCLCINSPFRDVVINQAKEIGQRYDFDAWFFDMLGPFQTAVCYNSYCVAKWKARTGKDLPNPLPKELFPEYLEFQTASFRSLYKTVRDNLKAAGRDVPMTHNAGLDYSDDDFLFQESNPGGSDYYETSMNAKLMRARAHGREVQMCPHLNNHYLDYVNAPVEKVQWQQAVITSNNTAAMWGQQSNIDGTIDPATVNLAAAAFQVADRLAPKVRGTVPYAEVAILASDQDVMLKARGGRASVSAESFGAHKMLADLHWPYDVVFVSEGEQDSLSTYRLVIIPDVHYLSAGQVQGVLRYLEKGGNVFVSGRCGLYDLKANPHAATDLGLVKIKEETDMPRGYLKPVFPIGDERLEAPNISTIEPDQNQKVWANMIRLSATDKEGFSLSEVAYPMDVTDQRVIVGGRKGMGNYTFVGYKFFEEYRKQSLPVQVQVFRQLVAGHYQPEIWVEAPTVLEAIYNQLGSELRVSLINGTTGRPAGSGGFGGAGGSAFINISEFVPVQDAKIVLRGKNVLQATNLAGEKLGVTTEQGNTVILVPHVEQYDLISVQLS